MVDLQKMVSFVISVNAFTLMHNIYCKCEINFCEDGVNSGVK